MSHIFRTFILTMAVSLTMVSCHPSYADAKFASNNMVNRIAGYVTCPADTIRMMLTAADSICKLAEGASLENLGLDDDIYNIPLKIRFHKEIPVLVQIYATYDVVTNFPSAYANAPFAWHEVALQQMADYYEKEQVTNEDIEALFGAMNAILDDYDCGTQYDLNISAARSVMLADFRLLSAYKNLFAQCQTPSLLESVHGSYEYLLEIYSDRYNNVTSQGYWSDQPRELSSMLVCMMNEKREWVEALQSRLEKGEINVEQVKSELDARPADVDDWYYGDY